MSDTEMILKMLGATVLNVIITALLWLYWRKQESHSRAMKVFIGVLYGACSVAATHIGINYFSMVLNVRDIGPLAAGLFFSPLSGILAGLIGGLERIAAGEIWEVGKFTELACGLSTMLSGFLSAALHRWVYRGRRPTTIHSFFLGAVMEVFHMYAILFTHRDSTNIAYYVVKSIAVPMILFTAAGVMLCSWVVRRISGEPSDIGWHVKSEDTPLSIHFQRWLLTVTLLIFAFNFCITYSFQTRLVYENASMDLYSLKLTYAAAYPDHTNPDLLKEKLNQWEDYSTYYFLIDAESGEVAHTNIASADPLPAEQLEALRELAGSESSVARRMTLSGIDGLCTVCPISSTHLLVFMVPSSTLFESRDSQLYEDTLSQILLFTALYMLVAGLLENLVVKGLHRVNSSLDRITKGNLDETVWVHTSSEMTELSTDINKTVATLKGYIAQAEQRMKDELNTAAVIQDAALPKNFNLPTDRIDLYALMVPARGIGGDFYDFFYLGQDLLVFVIADVSGKGVPAALFMMRAKTAIKNSARSGSTDPAELLETVNGILRDGNEAEMFVSVWLGILNLNTGIMRCANAGHEYPVLMRAGGEYKLLKDSHGLVLGAMDTIHLKGYEIRFEPGDRLLVYTDGVPEAINPKNEAYGTGRLTAKLNKVKVFTQKPALESILQDIRNFSESAEQFDDITMLGFTYLPGD